MFVRHHLKAHRSSGTSTISASPEMSVKEARMMFIGRFANLNMIHAKISRREYIKDYVEWTFENQEVVYKYVRCD
jgi:hypothetical protein